MSFSVRTDLAIEASAMLSRKAGESIDGVEVDEYKKGCASVTRVTVTNKNGENVIGKPAGKYITIECEDIRGGSDEALMHAEDAFADELGKLTAQLGKGAVLVVGLGNRFITPDALGPNTVDSVEVTRHLFEQMPERVNPTSHSVCALAPGVLGITGIETLEIIRGVVDRVQPGLIIAIDALASRSIRRISTTIQLADTGITPGSGIGNRRMGINEQSLGVPVIAVGVPTVVDAATIANDAIELIMQAVNDAVGEDSDTMRSLGFLNDDNRYEMIRTVLYPSVGDLIVTPKEVDTIIQDISGVVARGINRAVGNGY